MGHTLGAAGGLEAIVCAQVLRHGEIPPTKNLENPALEDGCDLNYCPGEKVSRGGGGGVRVYHARRQPESVPSLPLRRRSAITPSVWINRSRASAFVAYCCAPLFR